MADRHVKSIGPYKQVFVDDYLIEESSGLEMGFHPPEKYEGNPVLAAEHPWESEIMQANAVLFDAEENLYKMWYGGGYYACYATSVDGINWEKPVLGIVDHEGSKENNIVEGMVHKVIYSPEMRGKEPPERLYKSFFDTKFLPEKKPGGGWLGKAVSFSKDGFHWVPYEGNPVLVGAVGDVNTVCRNPEDVLHRFALNPVPKWMKEYEKTLKFFHSFLFRYLAFVKLSVRIGRFDRRSVGISYSEDFTNWAYPHLILAPDERDDEMADDRIEAARGLLEFEHPDDHHTHFYGMDVFPYAGIYLGFLFVFDAAMEMDRVGKGNQSGPMHIQLVSSRDLYHWRRLGDRQPFIPNGELDEIDCGMICGVNAVVSGDTIKYFYNGNNASHGGLTRKDHGPVRTGACIAESRLDGFTSIDAGDGGGALLTKELSFSGKELVINAAATDGTVEVELLKDGRPAEGFSSADCDAFHGDEIRHTVSWKGKTDVVPFSGKPVRLRFSLKNAKLFAFQFV